MSEKNKAISLRFFEELLNKGSLEVADKFVADNYVDHLPSVWGEWKGAEGVKNFTIGLRTAFPDAHYRIGDAIAEGDKVAVRWTFGGTNLGKRGDNAPTGKKAEFTGISIFRFEGGKCVESWSNADDLSLMQQLGVHTATQEGTPVSKDLQ